MTGSLRWLDDKKGIEPSTRNVRKSAVKIEPRPIERVVTEPQPVIEGFRRLGQDASFGDDMDDQALTQLRRRNEGRTAAN